MQSETFFLAIAGLAIDNDENYKWVKTIYIDDPISSLDDNNVITVASLSVANSLKAPESLVFPTPL
jgi:wobble nucleotide-excising tRNase